MKLRFFIYLLLFFFNRVFTVRTTYGWIPYAKCFQGQMPNHLNFTQFYYKKPTQEPSNVVTKGNKSSHDHE